MGAESTVTFLGRPKPVEVHHRDRWHIGALLGWRHDADGTCRLRVTALVDGYKRTAWVDLDTVRLPLPPARPAVDPRTERLPRHGDRDVRMPPPAVPRPRSWARPDAAVEPLRPTPA